MTTQKNDIVDWYQKIGEKRADPKKDKNFKNHYILPESRIFCLGQSGAGKTTFLMEFLSRVGDKFYDFLLFTGSTSNEPLYKFLKEKVPEIKVFTDINQFPKLTEMDENDKHEKLVVIDDFINLDKKGMQKIKEWVNSCRKYHFTCILMAQNIVDVPSQIRRNANYFAIFRLNDVNSIQHVLRTYAFGLKKDNCINMYNYCTQQPKHFFFIDCLTTEPEKRFRHNLLEFLNPVDYI
jgi:GTPase SAR1 family protein